jgi:curved DNA-binding protein CbpA
MTRDEAAALLGVTVEATGTEVQKAFLRLARRVHPDVLPDATDAQRREAAERFDALVQARRTLLEPGTAASADDGWAPSAAGWQPRPGDPTGPRYRPVAARGLGNSLVVLVLLAFLLVALVTVDSGLRRHEFQSPVDGATPIPAATR